jgi:hypothetical protein
MSGGLKRNFEAAGLRMSVSVVIPVRDEAETIGRTLDDLRTSRRLIRSCLSTPVARRHGRAIAAHALAWNDSGGVVDAGAAHPDA